METKDIQTQIEDINRKLDFILEEIEHQKRGRIEKEELKDDLMIIGKDLYDTTVTELEQISQYVNTQEILALGKKLLRNITTISSAIEQLESLRDFLNDLSPISRETFKDLMLKLEEFDKKGYFDFLKEFGKVIDNVVTSFSKEDVKALADNVVTILNTVKNLTQPDMLHTVNNAISIYKNLDIEITEKVTLFSLLKELNSPELKKGLAFAVQFLKNVANPRNGKSLNQKSIENK